MLQNINHFQLLYIFQNSHFKTAHLSCFRSDFACYYNYYFTNYILIVALITDNNLAELRFKMYIKNRHIFIF